MVTGITWNYPRGILEKLGGGYIAARMSELPPPGASAPSQAQVELEVDALGLVRITYTLKSSMHGKSARRWFWTAIHAEVVAV